MKKVIPTFTTLALAGILVSCGTTPSETTPSAPAAKAPPIDAAPPANIAPPAAASLVTSTTGEGVAPVVASADAKTFSKIVSYPNPAGEDKVQITIETVNNIITSVTVTPMATHDISQKNQTSFAASVNVAVGKPLAGLKLDTIGGASLTTKAFNEYVQSL